MNGTAFPSHPGMVPAPADNSEAEHRALCERIKHGHDGVRWIPIGGRDARTEEFTSGTVPGDKQQEVDGE